MYIYICIYPYASISIYTYMHTCIHTCLHTYTYTVMELVTPKPYLRFNIKGGAPPQPVGKGHSPTGTNPKAAERI